MSVLKVAVGQFPATNDIDLNIKKIKCLYESAAQQNAELIVLPEASMCSFASELEVLKKLAKEETPRFIEQIKAFSKEFNMYTIVGVLSNSSIEDDSRIENHLLVIDPNGLQIVDYSKIHVYDAFSFKESDKVRPATLQEDSSHFGIFNIKEFKIGLINCYDLRFPELARSLIDLGANVLSVSANWVTGAFKETHWEILLRARAIENTSYVLASGQTRPKGVGLSMIIDPLGFIINGCGDEEGVIVSEINSDRLNKVRQLVPCLANRRLT
ncbi:carbon-nitrogen hydrolase family protein [Taylorella equigenitalis]|uniref:carbon-nitrogen hydrolase family protein n=1 Tax=Taylorella equigenitalis TaxID=29575 RepID=UPI00237D24C6|nr:carbon-nitrogen hydrolase family protein [Taylorella equigenitalis]WDU54593.1 carbon-nitrogen hydrolase family protein [Taylorella equigenitalis]